MVEVKKEKRSQKESDAIFKKSLTMRPCASIPLLIALVFTFSNTSSFLFAGGLIKHCLCSSKQNSIAACLCSGVLSKLQTT